MAANTGLRTVWITLRAVNYTERVFMDMIRSIEKLKQTEAQMDIANMRAGTHALSAGLMWATLGQSMDDSMSKSITNISILQQLWGATKPYIATLITLAGVIQMIVGIESIYMSLKTSKIVSIYAEAIAVNILGSAWKTAAISMMAAFGIFFALKPILGTLPSLLIGIAVAVGIMAVQLWVAAGAMSILTWGLAAVAGGLAITGAIAALSGIREFPMGTRGVDKTGPAIVHQGEVIYNPATNRPTQIGNDIAGSGGHGTTVYEMPIHIGTVNTKADIDDVDEKLRISLHKIARNTRG